VWLFHLVKRSCMRFFIDSASRQSLSEDVWTRWPCISSILKAKKNHQKKFACITT